MDCHVFYALRARKDLSQAKLAKLVGRSQPYISQFENGRVELGDAEMRKLERALALGEPIEGESRPAYGLFAFDRFQRLEPLLTHDGRVGLYRNSFRANTTRRALKTAGITTYVVPVWLGYAARLALGRPGKKAAPTQGLFVVDAAEDATDRALAVVGHAADLIRAHVDQLREAEEAERQAAKLVPLTAVRAAEPTE